MNKILQKITAISFVFIGFTLNAQNVGINATGAAPLGGAMLDISSTNKGLLIPRVNITNLTTIAPITGGATISMLVYNTNAGTGLGYHYWDGADWIKFTTGNPLVDNGLYYNVGASRVRLGGALVENTTVTQGARQMTFNLNGTGDFNVQDNGTTRFSVRDNGRVTVGGTGNTQAFNVTGQSYFSDDLFLRDGSVTGGDILVRIFDSGDDGLIDIYENNARNIRLHGNGVSVFNEQGIASNDFRIESDNQANMFFINAGTNRIGIRTGAPANMFHMTNGGQNVGAGTTMASFDNSSGAGVALTGNNISTANGFNGVEGVTNGLNAGTAGIALTAGAGGDGVNGGTNDWQSIGVIGSRFNSGGANSGFGGLFLNDLGFTGGAFNVSDKRLKKDIVPIENALDIINKLKPVKYYFDLEKYPYLGLNPELEYGFLSQDVQEVLPEIVREKSLPVNGAAEFKKNAVARDKNELFLMMDYTRLIPIAIEGIKEQQVIIEQQSKRIEALENLVKQLIGNK